MPSDFDPLDGKKPPRHAPRWLTVFDDERGTLKLEFYRGIVSVHSEFRKPIAAMRAAKAVFPDLKAWLRSLGHRHLYTAIPDDANETLLRFERSFGFSERKRMKGWLILSQEC